jgi:hypothetical protein
MPWITSALAGIWGYVGAAAIVAALAIAGTHYADKEIYGLQIAQLQLVQANTAAANVTASLSKLQSYIANMQAAGVEYGATKDALFAKLDSLNRNFSNAIKATPLPADCRPDDARVRALATAIAAANAAAGAAGGYGETVRTTH